MGPDRPAPAHTAGEHGRPRLGGVELQRPGDLQGLVGEGAQGAGGAVDEHGGLGQHPQQGAQAGQGGQLGGGADQQQASPGRDVGGEALAQAGDGAGGGEDHHPEAVEEGSAGGALQLGQLDDADVADPFGAEDGGGVAPEPGAALAGVDEDGDPAARLSRGGAVHRRRVPAPGSRLPPAVPRGTPAR
jgi:hypothetical protein